VWWGVFTVGCAARSQAHNAFGGFILSVKVTQTACIREELDAMHAQVSQRAYELSRMNRSPRNTPEENWFNAQRELIWEPPVEVRQIDDRFEIIAAVAGVEPKDLDLQVAPEALLITGRGHEDCGADGVVHHCDFSRGRLFRPIRFPEAMAIENTVAEYRNGLLRITVPVMSPATNPMVTESVEVAAAAVTEPVEEAKPAARKAKARSKRAKK